MTPMERIESELQEARQRIAELERYNVGLANESCAQQEQITELKNALARQAKAAKQGMDAAKAAAYTMEQNASRMYAECGPEALESERAANALLTERIAELEEREAALAACVEKVQRLADNDRVDDEFYDEDGDLRTGNGWKSKLGRDLHLALQGVATVILTKRDLIKQAEALERMGGQYERRGLDMEYVGRDILNHTNALAKKLRQQAEAEQ